MDRRQDVYWDFFFLSSNCLLLILLAPPPPPSSSQKGKRGRKLSRMQGKVRISLGAECTITAEARAFLYAGPAPSACTTTRTHTHADIVDTKPSLYRGLFRFKCLKKWDRKWEFQPPLLDMLSLWRVFVFRGLFSKTFVYVCQRHPQQARANVC